MTQQPRISAHKEYRQSVLFEVCVGSRLYGIHNEDSDYDIRAVVMPPPDYMRGYDDRVHKSGYEIFPNVTDLATVTIGQFVADCFSGKWDIVEYLWAMRQEGNGYVNFIGIKETVYDSGMKIFEELADHLFDNTEALTYNAKLVKGLQKSIRGIIMPFLQDWSAANLTGEQQHLDNGQLKRFVGGLRRANTLYAIMSMADPVTWITG